MCGTKQEAFASLGAASPLFTSFLLVLGALTLLPVCQTLQAYDPTDQTGWPHQSIHIYRHTQVKVKVKPDTHGLDNTLTNCPYFVYIYKPTKHQFYRRSKKMALFYMLQML
jgi:hypothetical protein